MLSEPFGGSDSNVQTLPKLLTKFLFVAVAALVTQMVVWEELSWRCCLYGVLWCL